MGAPGKYDTPSVLAHVREGRKLLPPHYLGAGHAADFHNDRVMGALLAEIDRLAERVAVLEHELRIREIRPVERV